MQLELYLARIGYGGPLEPTPRTLYALHRAHLFAVPYENLDIHLGRPLTLSLPDIFDKLVMRGRGGRAGAPPKPQPDHLVLRVDADRSYLADVGFGDGILEPLPLEPGAYRQGIFDFALTREADLWRFQNHPHGAAPGFVFTLEPRALADFAGMGHTLQTSPESGFVRVTVCQKLTRTGVVTLRGATFREVTAAGVTERTLESADEFNWVLRERFGLVLPEAPDLWKCVWASHRAWTAAQDAR